MKKDQEFKVAIFASGSGTNAERMFEHFKNHERISIVLLLSNNPGAFALQRAAKANIPTMVFNREQLKQGDVLKWLEEYGVTHVVLAGFLWLIPSNLTEAFPNKIVNIHPALLPKFGGKGMYGAKVHEAVKASGEKETGITIHLVNEKYDDGAIIFQGKTPIGIDDTPDHIAEKVHALEYAHYPQVVENWILSNI